MTEPPPTDPSLQVRYQNTLEDLNALERSLPAAQRFWRRWGALLLVLGAASFCCVPGTLLLLARGQVTAVLIGWGSLAVLLAFASFLAITKANSPDADAFRPLTLALRPEFLEIVGERGWERRDWSRVAKLQRTDELFVIHRDDGLVYPVPRRAFASSATEEAFCEAAQRFHEQGQAHSPLGQPAAWQDAPGPVAVFADDTLQVSYSSTAPELIALKRGMVLQSVEERSKSPPKPLGVLPWILVLSVMLMAFFVLSQEHLVAWVLVFGGIAVAMIWPMIALVKAVGFRRAKSGLAVMETLTIAPEGISLWSPGLENRSAWESIDEVQENDKVVAFCAKRPGLIYVNAVPKSAFPDLHQAQHFAQTAARFVRLAADRKAEQEPAPILREISDNPYQSPGPS